MSLSIKHIGGEATRVGRATRVCKAARVGKATRFGKVMRGKRQQEVVRE
jgi:hypothetical protein